ncbi:MAG: transcriptional repressor [Microscillaceae bacterium]|nr:transcriptional repressor [Microscillaceae bacterium]MDW8460970.1 transcriptional repressor [Cytophagales bacterium]
MIDNHKQSELFLSKYGLRTTACRLAMINLFQTKNFALSQADIENSIGAEFDRVTIYRTLKTFQEKGIIHKVLDDVSTPKYALCPAECYEYKYKHNDTHVHFKCLHCGQTNCLYELQIPKLTIPQGYLLQETYFLISGLCKQCNTPK